MILPAHRRNALTQQARTYAGNLDLAMDYLLSRSISREAAEMFGLGYVTEGEYQGRLSIPYQTPAGVVLIKYRCADLEHGDHKETNCPKYLYDAGSSVHLYNAHALTRADRCVVTEGELDSVCIQAYCGVPAVGYPGVETWKKQKHWRLCFEGISEVIVVADGDKVGREAARNVAESIGMSARVVNLPDGDDSNSYMARHGAGAFLEVISE